MQLDFLDSLLEPSHAKSSISDYGVVIGNSTLPLECVRHNRAKRYIIRLLPEQVLRVTIPRGGSRKEALRFVSENYAWVEKQFLSQRLNHSRLAEHTNQTDRTVLFRGRRIPTRLLITDHSLARISDQLTTVSTKTGSAMMKAVEQILHRFAKMELVETTFRLAKHHGFAPKRVSIRNQKTRWGSCSSSGAISLNWRLVQVPSFVRDYVILHELVHLDHLNHSARFWKRLAKICPNYKAAEVWLKREGEATC